MASRMLTPQKELRMMKINAELGSDDFFRLLLLANRSQLAEAQNKLVLLGRL